MAAIQQQRAACNIDVASLDASLVKAAYCPTKLFIGGLSKKSTSKTLRDYFSKYGRVLDCVAMTKGDGQARSFGFVTLNSVDAAQSCLADTHMLDGHVLDVKPTEGKGVAASPSVRGERKQKNVELPVPAKLRAPPGLGLMSPMAIGAPPGLPEPLPIQPAQKPEEVDEDASSTAPPSSASNRDESDEESQETAKEESEVQVDTSLPSEGSKLHATGNCKPCNFFAKGTCASGPACGFCHLTHEKRRATRQEKRDRHDRWLQKQATEKAAVSEEARKLLAAAAAADEEGSEGSDASSELHRRWSRNLMLEVYAAMKQKETKA